MSEVSLETLVSLCKRRGFIFQGSEVYGGLAGTWDYGPLGIQLKRNVMNAWWQAFVDGRDDMFGVDAAILMNKKVWEASGHASGFNDPMIECGNCHSRFRVDKIITNNNDYEAQANKLFTRSINSLEGFPDMSRDYKAENWDRLKSIFADAGIPEYETKESFISSLQVNKDLAKKYLGIFPRVYLINKRQRCDNCGMIQWQDANTFNMMFKTKVGPVDDGVKITVNDGNGNIIIEDDEYVHRIDREGVVHSTGKGVNPATSYLRPETAQGIFTNYKNVVDSFYPNVPFGIAQQGKAFRNEISPRDFVFRSREFEQMEIEYFVHENEWEKLFEQWRNDIQAFLNKLGLPADKVHELEVPEDDRAHYSKRTIDFEFDYPHGRDELLGLAYRTDFDLQNIQKASGKNMEYKPKDGGAPFVPHVIEPSFGVERLIMAVLTSAYTEDEVGGEKRVVLKLKPELAPYRVAVSPLLKNKPELAAKAREVYATLKKEFGNVMYDDNGNIGKRYRRQDEIGTPYCVTIDFDTLEDDTVTVRDRDTTEQERLKIESINERLKA